MRLTKNTLRGVLKIVHGRGENMGLCSHCKKNIGLCEYSKNLKPIKGWKAKVKSIQYKTRGSVKYKEIIYNVLKCPEYESENNGITFEVRDELPEKSDFKHRLCLKVGDRVKIPAMEYQKNIIAVVEEIHRHYAVVNTGKYRTTVKLINGKVIK